MTTRLELERWLVRRVAQIVGVSPASIDRDKRLDRLGLDSMSLIGLLADIEQLTGQPVETELLSEHRTIAAIAAAVEEQAR